MIAAVMLLALVGGAVTTLAGAGGGVLLILSLSLLLGPHVALAATAPTLLVGNLHRLVLYRDRIDRSVAVPIILGALPGSVVGGAMAMTLPSGALRLVFATITGYAVARAFGALTWAPPRALLAPAGALLGGVSATSGGAGLLMSPLLLSSGLSGETYIATSAAVAFSTHVGRLAAYGARGFLSTEVLGYAAVATVAVVLGNLAGDRIRPILEGPRRRAIVESGTLAVCSALAVAGLVR